MCVRCFLVGHMCQFFYFTLHLSDRYGDDCERVRVHNTTWAAKPPGCCLETLRTVSTFYLSWVLLSWQNSYTSFPVCLIYPDSERSLLFVFCRPKDECAFVTQVSNQEDELQGPVSTWCVSGCRRSSYQSGYQEV